MTQQELFDAIDQFQQINAYMMALGSRLQIQLFGRAIASLNSSAATGSMMIVTSNTERAHVVRQWVKSKEMRSDTVVNQAKELLSRWQFWAKFLFGMAEYKPHQLRQEAVVLDAQTGQATSNVSPRIGIEFGFGLEEIAGVVG